MFAVISIQCKPTINNHLTTINPCIVPYAKQTFINPYGSCLSMPFIGSLYYCCIVVNFTFL